MSLSAVLKYEPEMKRLGVSEVARSPRGFLTAYKKLDRMIRHSDKWMAKRSGFIARHLVQYRRNPTYRRWLALVAWAYKPDNKFG